MIYSFPDFNRTSYNSNERRMFGYVILSNTKKWVLSSLLGNSHFLVFISEFSFVFVVSIPSQAGQTHNLGIAEIAIKFLGEFSDYLFAGGGEGRDGRSDTSGSLSGLLP